MGDIRFLEYFVSFLTHFLRKKSVFLEEKSIKFHVLYAQFEEKLTFWEFLV